MWTPTISNSKNLLWNKFAEIQRCLLCLSQDCLWHLLQYTATWGGKAGLASVRRSPSVWQPVWRPLPTVLSPASAVIERANTDILAKTFNSEGLNFSALGLNFSALVLNFSALGLNNFSLKPDSVEIADSSWKLLKRNCGIPYGIVQDYQFHHFNIIIMIPVGSWKYRH